MRAGILLRPTWPSVPPTGSALRGSAEPVLDYLVKIAETHHRDREFGRNAAAYLLQQMTLVTVFH
jgi:hypothetical protein